jgi:hypothetical protein
MHRRFSQRATHLDLQRTMSIYYRGEPLLRNKVSIPWREQAYVKRLH